MAFGTRHCYVCDSDNVEKKAFAQHVKDHSQERLKFSNSTIDYCRTLCKICGKALQITTMRQHTKNDHNMVITEYKKKYNQEYFDIVEKVFHKCGLCQLPILLDSDVVASHLHSNKATHNMSHKEYNLKFMVLQQQTKGQRKQKSNEPKSSNERGPKVMKYTDLQFATAGTSKEVKDDHFVIQGNLQPVEASLEDTAHTENHSLMNAGESLLEEEVPESETIAHRDDEEMETNTTGENFDTLADDVDSNQWQANHLSSQETETSWEDDSLTIELFRSFIASITAPGLSPVSYPAIEKVLGMDVAQEERIVTDQDGRRSKWTKLSTSFNSESDLGFN